MPGSTARGYPYPTSSDAPDVPSDVAALASAVDADVTALQQARQMERNTTVNVSDSTATLIAAYNVGTDYNVGGIAHSAGVLTVSEDGLYRWALTSDWPSDSGASNYRRAFWVQVNGTDRDEGRTSVPMDSNPHAAMLHSGGGEIVLAANDQMQAVLWQNSGSTLAVTPRFFTLVRVA